MRSGSGRRAEDVSSRQQLLPAEGGERAAMRQTMRSSFLAAACWAPLVGAQLPTHGCAQYQFAGIFPTGTHSMDWGDAQSNAGFCAGMLATGALTCANTFAPGMGQAGFCDYTCHFCQPADIFRTLPACQTYTNTNNGLATLDYYDEWVVGGCAAILANEKHSCDTTFSPSGSMPHHCDGTCGYCKGESTPRLSAQPARANCHCSIPQRCR